MSAHPTSEISPDATIGDNTRVWHHAQIRENARIGSDCIIGKGTYIDFDVVIGDRVKIQNGCFLYHGAKIEDEVFLGPSVILTNDRIPRATTPEGDLKTESDWQTDPTCVSRGASIGAGVVVLSGITIGQYAMVGAGAVVTRDVPDFGLVVGNPARLVGYVCRCGKTRAADPAFLTDCPHTTAIDEPQPTMITATAR